jgi:hypothetical protein
MTHPIVSWTTPTTRAQNALAAAGEHMEFKRWTKARAELHAVLTNVRETLHQIDLAEEREEEVARAQREHAAR